MSLSSDVRGGGGPSLHVREASACLMGLLSLNRQYLYFTERQQRRVAPYLSGIFHHHRCTAFSVPSQFSVQECYVMTLNGVDRCLEAIGKKFLFSVISVRRVTRSAKFIFLDTKAKDMEETNWQKS